MANNLKYAALLALACFAGCEFSASAQESGQDNGRNTGLEYRLKVQDGVPFAFDHSEEQYFGRHPFMTAKDFASVAAGKSKNPNTPGDWEIELTHTAVGREKFHAVADADRSREFCLVFHGALYECQAFPPDVKGVYDKGITVTGNFDRAKAEKLAGEMRREIESVR